MDRTEEPRADQADLLNELPGLSDFQSLGVESPRHLRLLFVQQPWVIIPISLGHENVRIAGVEVNLVVDPRHALNRGHGHDDEKSYTCFLPDKTLFPNVVGRLLVKPDEHFFRALGLLSALFVTFEGDFRNSSIAGVYCPFLDNAFAEPNGIEYAVCREVSLKLLLSGVLLVVKRWAEHPNLARCYPAMLAQRHLRRFLGSPFGLADTVAPKQRTDVLSAIAGFPLLLVLTGVLQRS